MNQNQMRQIVETLKFFKKPVLIRTSGVKHNICDVNQCCICYILDDPHLMDDINGKAYCGDCSDKYYEKNPPQKLPNGKLIPPKRLGITAN